MTRYASACVAALGGLAALAPASPAQTVDGGAGSVTTAFFESTLEGDTNYNLIEDSLGNALIWTNTIGAGLEQRTETDTFLIDVQGSYRYGNLPSRSDLNTFDDPRLDVLFSRELGEDYVVFTAALRRVSLDFFNPLRNVGPDGNFDNSTNGERESANVTFDMRINDDGPVIFALDGLYNVVRFTDTDDPDNNDRNIAAIGTELGFRVNPLLTATLGAQYEERVYENDSLDDRYRTTVDAGFDALINQRMTGYFRIGYSEVDVRGDGTDRQENGLVGRIGFSAEMQDGVVRADASSELNEFGTRNRITAGRLIVFPSAQLDFNLGATNSGVTNTRPIGYIAYRRLLPRATLDARLQQQAAINDDSQNTLVTLLNLGYEREITRVSAFDFGIEAGLTRFENSDEADNRRGSVRAAYRRALTRDWDVDLGYRYQWRSTESVDNAQSNSVFLSLSREWSALR